MSAIIILSLILLALISLLFIYIDKVHIVWVALTDRHWNFYRLKRFAKRADYLFMTKLSFLQKDQAVAVIDMLLIAEKYIYVIKNRQWLGDLSGVVIDNKWLLYQGNKIFHVTNPLKENEEYIDFVKQLIEAEREDFINVVVFPPTVNLAKINLDANQELVTSRRLIKLIKRMEKRKDVANFSEEAIEKAIMKISDYYIKRGNHGQI